MKLASGYSNTLLIRCCAVAVLLIGVHTPLFAQSRTCTVQQEDKADAALGHVKTWPMLVDWHRRYAGCDEASTAEGVSDVAAKLLTTGWPGLMQLGPEFRRDHSLRAFLIRHIDTAMTEVQANQIKMYSTAQCTVGNEQLCRAISKEIDDLLTEIK